MSLRGHKVASTTAAQAVRYLVVELGSTCYAFPAEGVRGIITPRASETDDTVTIGGEAYGLTDLTARWELQGIQASPTVRLILYSDGASVCAFRVDHVVGLTEIDRAMMLPLPAHFRGGEREWFTGLFLHLETVALIVNANWLLAPTRAALDHIPRTDHHERQQHSSSRPAQPLAPILPYATFEVEEASDAEDTPWAPI